MIWILLYLIGILPSLWFMCKTAISSNSNGEIFLCALLWPIMLPIGGILELKEWINDPLNKLINKWINDPLNKLINKWRDK